MRFEAAKITVRLLDFEAKQLKNRYCLNKLVSGSKLIISSLF